MNDLTPDQKREITSARRLHDAGAVPADLRALGYSAGAIIEVLKEAAYKPITCGEH